MSLEEGRRQEAGSWAWWVDPEWRQLECPLSSTPVIYIRHKVGARTDSVAGGLRNVPGGSLLPWLPLHWIFTLMRCLRVSDQKEAEVRRHATLPCWACVHQVAISKSEGLVRLPDFSLGVSGAKWEFNFCLIREVCLLQRINNFTHNLSMSFLLPKWRVCRWHFMTLRFNRSVAGLFPDPYSRCLSLSLLILHPPSFFTLLLPLLPPLLSLSHFKKCS